MDYGLEVRDAKGVQTLGMEDFTLQKLAQMTLPSSYTAGQGVRTDYILMDVPGYDPATCFVTITPKLYSPNAQGAGAPRWGFVPTYKNLGGTRIGIYTYANYSTRTGDGDKRINLWVSRVVECVVEVVRVA